MLIFLILGITFVYIAVVVCLYLTAAMPDLLDIQEINWE